jgi:hypothetical protein
MIKVWVFLLSMLIGARVLEPLPADAACTQSRIDVITESLVFGATIPVTWRITPACDVIETGLMLSVDSAAWVPVGQRVYGLRSTYHQFLTVGESRSYWIVAYALDEDGAVTWSAPQAVSVAIPPRIVAPHGSHGAPPSYNGTDEDFLRQAGNPHFASLRSAVSTKERFLAESLGPNAQFVRISGEFRRDLASTDPGEVLLGQGDALTVGDFTFRANPSDLQSAITQIDENFAILFPRTGLYAVTCEVSVEENVVDPRGVVCRPDAAVYLPNFRQLSSGMGYRDDLTELTGPFGFLTTTRTRSTASYFIPRLEPGKRLVSARLESFLVVNGDPSAVSVSGKPAQLQGPFTCNEVNFFCFGFARWDFSADAAAVAAEGGGELLLTFDPSPPIEINTPPSRRRIAGYGLGVDANYPWSHGGSFNALTLTFQETCSKNLKNLMVTATPPKVRPVIPRITRPRANVEVTVQACPPDGNTPAIVEVNLRVEPPAPDSVDAAGHLHDTRPPRAVGTLDGKQETACSAPIDAQGMGKCPPLTYRPSEVSGVETIMAWAQGFPEARAAVTVQVPGLVDLAAVPTNFFRLTGRLSQHPDHHWGTADTVANIQLVALDFLEAFGATLGINDLSLPWGGLFDICGTWNQNHRCPPHAPDGGHKSHRTGTGVDIDRTACVDPNLQGRCDQTVSVPRNFIQRRCFARGTASLAPEPSYHCEWPQ